MVRGGPLYVLRPTFASFDLNWMNSLKVEVAVAEFSSRLLTIKLKKLRNLFCPHHPITPWSSEAFLGSGGICVHIKAIKVSPLFWHTSEKFSTKKKLPGGEGCLLSSTVKERLRRNAEQLEASRRMSRCTSGPEIDRHTDAATVSIIHTPPLLSCLGIVANTQEVCTLEPGGRPPCAPFDSAREHRSACIRSRCQSHHLVSCNNRRHESFLTSPGIYQRRQSWLIAQPMPPITKRQRAQLSEDWHFRKNKILISSSARVARPDRPGNVCGC